MSNGGAYLKITFSAAITSLSSKNGATYVLQYKKSSATSYSSVTLSNYTGKYSVSGGTYVFAADTASSYNLILKATDNFSSTTANSTGPSITELWSWLKKNKGVAFGKIAELVEYFDVAWNARFRKNVTVDGTVTGNDVLTASGVSLNELNTNTDNTKTIVTRLNNMYRRIYVSSSSPFEFTLGIYGTVLIFGFLQGVGSVALIYKVNNNKGTLYDILTGNTFSSSYIDVSISNGIVTIATSIATTSNLVLAGCGASLS